MATLKPYAEDLPGFPAMKSSKRAEEVTAARVILADDLRVLVNETAERLGEENRG
jgi:hypothetical protein